VLLIAGALAVVVLSLVALAIWQVVSARQDSKRFPPPGSLSAIAGTRLHVLDLGHGTPAVVLEAGIAASSLSWRPLQQDIARFTRVISYDRAGLGWSELAAEPRSLDQLVSELHEVSATAAPFILVGHSFGGLIARAYTAKYPDRVAGLVLLDPVLPSEWCDLPKERQRLLSYGVTLSRRGALLARLGIVRLTLTLAERGGRFIPKLIAKVSSGKGSGVPERLIGEVRKLPPDLLPAIKAHWCQPNSFAAMASYLALLPNACEQARHWPPISVPLTIISAGNATPAQIVEWDRLAATSPNGQHIRALTAGHWVHLDEPGLVLTAIRQTLDRVSAL
jgi:pimeloyl-ACP methyl ester carboxylesterase